jgi:hypothetical protein
MNLVDAGDGCTSSDHRGGFNQTRPDHVFSLGVWVMISPYLEKNSDESRWTNVAVQVLEMTVARPGAQFSFVQMEVFSRLARLGWLCSSRRDASLILGLEELFRRGFIFGPSQSRLRERLNAPS